jgi:hypothetical protein
MVPGVAGAVGEPCVYSRGDDRRRDGHGSICRPYICGVIPVERCRASVDPHWRQSD